jgi:hypothetical protein
MTIRPVTTEMRSEKALLDYIRKQDPEAAAALEAKATQARTLRTQLASSRTSQKDSAKADAAQRLARIKQEIQAMKMQAGDPRQMLRRIAELKRELAQLARQLGASESGSAAASPDTPQTDAAATKQAATQAQDEDDPIAAARAYLLDTVDAHGKEAEAYVAARRAADLPAYTSNAAPITKAGADTETMKQLRVLDAKLKQLDAETARRLHAQNGSPAQQALEIAATAASETANRVDVFA